jgi:hypothetical protein
VRITFLTDVPKEWATSIFLAYGGLSYFCGYTSLMVTTKTKRPHGLLQIVQTFLHLNQRTSDPFDRAVAQCMDTLACPEPQGSLRWRIERQ